MNIEVKRIVKIKKIKKFLVQKVQLTDTLYAVLVFDSENMQLKYSSCTEIKTTGLNRIISSERKLLNKRYNDVINNIIYGRDLSVC